MPKPCYPLVMFSHVSVCPQGSGGIPACIAGLQVHTRGEVEGSGLGVSRPTSGDVSRSMPGGVSRPTPGSVGIPACTVADTPQQMAAAAGSMHPTGMHPCLDQFHWWQDNIMTSKMERIFHQKPISINIFTDSSQHSW